MGMNWQRSAMSGSAAFREGDKEWKTIKKKVIRA